MSNSAKAREQGVTIRAGRHDKLGVIDHPEQVLRDIFERLETLERAVNGVKARQDQHAELINSNYQDIQLIVSLLPMDVQEKFWGAVRERK